MLFFNKHIRKKKIDFLIIGAQKCGTTSLFNYLKEHPSLKCPNVKEIHYFTRNANYKLGEKWYHSHWKKFGEKKFLYFEATPAYWYLPYALERIANYNPELRFICLYRDPIKRAYSSYNMFKDFTSTKEARDNIMRNAFTERNPDIENFYQKVFNSPSGIPSFEEFVKEETELIANKDFTRSEPSFIRRGLYMEQLERYYRFFPKDRFILFESMELEKEPSSVLDKICNFLEISPIKWNAKAINQKHHSREYEVTIDLPTLTLLSKFYKPYSEAFFTHIGKKYEWI